MYYGSAHRLKELQDLVASHREQATIAISLKKRMQEWGSQAAAAGYAQMASDHAAAAERDQRAVDHLQELINTGLADMYSPPDEDHRFDFGGKEYTLAPHTDRCILFHEGEPLGTVMQKSHLFVYEPNFAGAEERGSWETVGEAVRALINEVMSA